MTSNRSPLEKACDKGASDQIDSLLASGARLSQHDGRAPFLTIIAAATNNAFREELRTAFLEHMQSGNSAFLSSHALAWHAFLDLAVKYENVRVVFTVCQKLYSNQMLYHEMKKQQQSKKAEFVTLLNNANKIYSGVLQCRAESLVQEFEDSYFYSEYDEKQLSFIIGLINEYFKSPEALKDADLSLARNNLVQCKLQISKSSRNITSQNDSTWKQLTNISSRLNLSIFKSYRDVLANKKEAKSYGIPGDRRPKVVKR